jgi:hypothetical protein
MKIIVQITGVIFVFFLLTSVMGSISPKGWPDNIAMGTVINGGLEDEVSNDTDLDAAFKYSSGSGAPGKILFPQPVRILFDIAKRFKTHHKNVIPVLVEYTANGSDGKATLVPDFKTDFMAKHLINLIIDCDTIEFLMGKFSISSASMILNPDFLGEIQKELFINHLSLDNKGATAFLGDGNPIEVNKALKKAVYYVSTKSHWKLGEKIDREDTPLDLIRSVIPGFEYHQYIWPEGESEFNIEANRIFDEIPENIPDAPLSVTDDFEGYCKAVNWIVKKYSPSASFGWMSNIWVNSGGNMYDGLWVHKNPPEKDINAYAEQIVNFWNSLKLYDGEYKPDFVVFDKYERNAFCDKGDDTFKKGWLWNCKDIQNYLLFVRYVAYGLKVPAMIWQIPGGHLAADVIDNEKYKMSTEPQFFFGDINFNDTNVSKLELSDKYDPYTGKKVGEYLSIEFAPANDWKKGHMTDAAESNIFAILWGGGNTTSIGNFPKEESDNGWLKDKVKKYNENPTPTASSLND